MSTKEKSKSKSKVTTPDYFTHPDTAQNCPYLMLLPKNTLKLKGRNIQLAIMEAAAKLAQEGHTLDVLCLDYITYTKLIQQLGGIVVYVDVKQDDYNWNGIEINTAYGKVVVIPDRNCTVPHWFSERKN